MTGYAKGTSVSAAKSRAEIESTVRRFGADEFIIGWAGNRALVSFRIGARYVRLELGLPDSSEFQMTPAGRRRRSAAQVEQVWEQACRESWRALAAVIKAKLVAVEAGITTMEQEFLAHTVLPDGKTIGDHVIPKVGDIYARGKMVPLLPGAE